MSTAPNVDAGQELHAPWHPSWPAHADELRDLKVCVLYGGRSSEREISLVSGRAILDSLAGRDDREGPPLAQVHAIEIDDEGRWVLEGRAHSPAAAIEALPADSVFFLGLHGGEGEDGRIQALLEVSGRAYTGTGHAASALCMDKHLARLTFAAQGLKVPRGRKLARGPESRDPVAPVQLAAAVGEGPWFVKPVHGGSSVGTARAETLEELAAAVIVVRELGDEPLVECAVAGLEVSVGVVGNRGSGLRVLPPVEILPRRGAFFDYREKYSDTGAIELCPAEHLNPEQELDVAARACRAFQAAGCDGYARVDLIVPEDPQAEPVILEANTLPGFTPRSLLPREARAVGVEFRSLCLEILSLAVHRHRGASR